MKKQIEVPVTRDVSSDVQVAVPWYGVVDPLSAKQGSATNDFDFIYRNLLGQEPETAPELDALANPLTSGSEQTVPFLLLHGTEDQVVPLVDSAALYQALVDHQVPADLGRAEGRRPDGRSVHATGSFSDHPRFFIEAVKLKASWGLPVAVSLKL